MQGPHRIILFLLAFSLISGLKIRPGHDNAKARKVKLHAFYLNMPSDVRRNQCLTAQLRTLFSEDTSAQQEGDFAVTRVGAVSLDGYKGTPQTLNQECKEAFHDWTGNLSHMSRFRKHPLSVEASYCGHVNMWRAMADAGDAQYYLALEDDTAFTKDFATWWKAFEASPWTQNPKRRWDVLYLDPFGTPDPSHLLGKFQDTDIYEPRIQGKTSKPQPIGQKHEYFGAHAYLIRADALPVWRDSILSSTPRPADHFMGNQKLCNRTVWSESVTDPLRKIWPKGFAEPFYAARCEPVEMGLKVQVATPKVTGQRSRSSLFKKKSAQPEHWLSLPECDLGDEAESRESYTKPRKPRKH